MNMKLIATKIVAAERADRIKNGRTTVIADRKLIKQIFNNAKVALYRTGNREVFSRIVNVEMRVNPLLRGTEKATPDEVEIIKIAVDLASASIQADVIEDEETLSITKA